MDRLPHELLTQILMHLNPSDRLNCSLTCRRWAEAFSDPVLLEDVWLIICGIKKETVLPVVLGSQRQYRNLRLVGTDLDRDSLASWARFGKHVRRLELIECKLGPDVFVSILRHCPKLESLNLRGYSQTITSLKRLKPARGTAGLREKSHSLRDFDTNFEVTDEIIKYLLELMPNVTSLALQTARYSDTPHLPRSILRASHAFTKLDLRFVDVSDKDLVNLVKKHSESIQVIRLDCSSLSRAGYLVISDCTQLRHLELAAAYKFRDGHLEELVRNAPNLTTLDFSWCRYLTSAGLTHAHALRGLGHFRLNYCPGITGDALRVLGTIQTLQALDLNGSGFEIRDIQAISCLKDLKILRLSADMNSEGFCMICHTFEKLEELAVGNCQTLTDAEGQKLCHLKHLKKLAFRNGIGFTDLTFEKGLVSSTMESLRVHRSPLTRAGLASIAGRHNRLRYLTFNDCVGITDAGLAALLLRQPLLKKLYIEFCNTLTDELLAKLADACPRLEYFVISRCPISARAAEDFQSRRPGLYFGLSS